MLSGWWFQPLWKIWNSVGIIISYIWENHPNIPNHQPDIHRGSNYSNPPKRCQKCQTRLVEKLRWWVLREVYLLLNRQERPSVKLRAAPHRRKGHLVLSNRQPQDSNAGRITKILGKNGWKTLTRNWKPTYRNKKDILYQIQGAQVIAKLT